MVSVKTNLKRYDNRMPSKSGDNINGNWKNLNKGYR